MFRILSLDGGGLMGAFSASVLATLERTTGRRIVDHFDLITGTSTGGIIAIGLAMGASAEQILRSTRSGARLSFPGRQGRRRLAQDLRNLRRPKFSPQALREAITSVVGDQPLSAARTRLAIPAYDASMGRIYVFKTPHHPGPSAGPRPARRSTSRWRPRPRPPTSPPTALPDHRGVFIDGGLWANCPAMVGIVEALAFCEPAWRTSTC